MAFVDRNRKAVAANLPEIIPELAQVMVHMRDGSQGGVHRVHGQGCDVRR